MCNRWYDGDDDLRNQVQVQSSSSINQQSIKVQTRGIQNYLIQLKRREKHDSNLSAQYCFMSSQLDK